MSEKEKVKNIIVFLSILFGDNPELNHTENDLFLSAIMNFTPEYLIEKFERYVLSSRSESDWGLHPTLRKNVFNRYCDKYNLPISIDL